MILMHLRTALFLLTSSFLYGSLYGQSLLPLWQTERVLQVPESVLYVPETHTIYVSCINGKPDQKDNNGYIAQLDEQGHILKRKWATGLNAPKGMAAYHHALYVSDIDRVVKINLATGKVVRYYRVPGSEFLNDIAIDDKGNVYISDSGKGVIYKLSGETIEIWQKGTDFKGVNGLNFDRGKLLAGAVGNIWEIDLNTERYSSVAQPGGMIDGLILLATHRYLISDWKGKIELVQKESEPVVLRNTTEEKINAADMGFIPSKKIVLIPTFYDNRVVAMQLIN